MDHMKRKLLATSWSQIGAGELFRYGTVLNSCIQLLKDSL